MLTALIPKLPMRDPAATRAYFVDRLGFTVIGQYADYLIMELDGLEIHFFLHADLDPLTKTRSTTCTAHWRTAAWPFTRTGPWPPSLGDSGSSPCLTRTTTC